MHCPWASVTSDIIYLLTASACTALFPAKSDISLLVLGPHAFFFTTVNNGTRVIKTTRSWVKQDLMVTLALFSLLFSPLCLAARVVWWLFFNLPIPHNTLTPALTEGNITPAKQADTHTEATNEEPTQQHSTPIIG